MRVGNHTRVEVMRHGYRYWVMAYGRFWSYHVDYAYAEPLREADGQAEGVCWVVNAAGFRHPHYRERPVTLAAAVLADPTPAH